MSKAKKVKVEVFTIYSGESVLVRKIVDGASDWSSLDAGNYFLRRIKNPIPEAEGDWLILQSDNGSIIGKAKDAWQMDIDAKRGNVPAGSEFLRHRIEKPKIQKTTGA